MKRLLTNNALSLILLGASFCIAYITAYRVCQGISTYIANAEYQAKKEQAFLAACAGAGAPEVSCLAAILK